MFGCDVCQEVCPWNRKVEATRDAAFAPGAHLRGRTLADLVGLDDATFRAGFRDTPLGRPRRQGLVRNALIVAANTGDDRALEAARGLREDPDPVIRETARWALGKGGYADQARPSRARSSSAPAGPRLPAR